MSRLLLLVLLLAAVPTASAQDAPEPTRGQRTVVALGALAGGIAVPSALYAGSTETWGSDVGRAVLIASALVGMALGTIAGADVLGLRTPALPEALSDAALGLAVGGAAFVLVGYGVGGGLYYAFGQQDYDFVSPAIGAAVGLAVGVPLALRLAVRSVEAGPATFRAPTGDQALGLAVRIGL